VEQRQRVELERSAASLEDFYYSLQQEVEVVPVTSATCPRVAQLTQKTNQFNLTTRRYSEQQIRELAASPSWRVYSVRVKDRFGDNGLVGVVVTRDKDAICEIDTFLLSCRVIGRTVETAVLSWVAEHARVRGIRQLQGWFFPTKKNAPAKEFYSTHGFCVVTEQSSGTLWALDLKEARVVYPQWVTMTQM
jgi:FkbH-like protein